MIAGAGAAIGFLLARTAFKPKLKKTAVRHIFLAKFRDTLSQKEIDEVVEAYASLASKIPEMKGFEWGTQITGLGLSSEKFNKGLTHAFVSTFDSGPDVKAFLDHPAHKEFAAKMAAATEDKVIHDYFVHVVSSKFFS